MSFACHPPPITINAFFGLRYVEGFLEVFKGFVLEAPRNEMGAAFDWTFDIDIDDKLGIVIRRFDSEVGHIVFRVEIKIRIVLLMNHLHPGHTSQKESDYNDD
jgi:hypothetical protein